MQKFMKVIAALMLTVAMVCAAGCTKPDDPNVIQTMETIMAEVVEVITTRL